MNDQYGHLVMPVPRQDEPENFSGIHKEPGTPDTMSVGSEPPAPITPQAPREAVEPQQPAKEALQSGSLIDQIPGETYEERGYRYTRLRPAYRTFLKHWSMAVPGALLLISPSFVASLVLGLLALVVGAIAGPDAAGAIGRPAPSEGGPPAWELIARLLGFSVVLWSMGAIGYKRFANRFKVSEDTVIQEYGLIKRERSQMSLAHIRAVDVKQGVVERLLGIGRLYFAGAGTAGTDVCWFGIRDPAAVQSVIQKVIRASAGQQANVD